jgi:SAM-dependent methyltransferase
MSPGEASDRQRWAVDQLDVQPRDRVLELGCGHGVAVSLICEQLHGGVVVGVDRSQKMIDAASKRNAVHITAGRARFVTAEIQEADLGDEPFNKVLAVRFPPLLRGPAGPTLAAIRDHLAEDGALYVVEHPLARDRLDGLADAIALRLRQHDFTVDSVLVEQREQPAVCIVASAPTVRP